MAWVGWQRERQGEGEDGPRFEPGCVRPPEEETKGVVVVSRAPTNTTNISSIFTPRLSV